MRPSTKAKMPSRYQRTAKLFLCCIADVPICGTLSDVLVSWCCVVVSSKNFKLLLWGCNVYLDGIFYGCTETYTAVTWFNRARLNLAIEPNCLQIQVYFWRKRSDWGYSGSFSDFQFYIIAFAREDKDSRCWYPMAFFTME